MASTPENDAFFREVDEELRRDQVETLFRRYGRLLIAAVLVGLAALAGFLWWQHDRQVKAGKDGEALTAAFADVGGGQSARAKATLDRLAGSSRPGYAAAARLTLGDVALAKGDIGAAAAAFKAIADDDRYGAPFRDLALVRQTQAEFDTLPPGQVVARLRPLAEAGNPWFGSAGEMVALAYLKLGKPELAGPLFAAMAKDDKVPATIRSRAQQMAGILGIGAIAQKPGGPSATARKE